MLPGLGCDQLAADGQDIERYEGGLALPAHDVGEADIPSRRFNGDQLAIENGAGGDIAQGTGGGVEEGAGPQVTVAGVQAHVAGRCDTGLGAEAVQLGLVDPT